MKRLLTVFLLAGLPVLAQERQVTVEKFEAPKYPPIGRNARINGDVKLRLGINIAGRVESTEVLVGHPTLKQQALENIKQWVFKCFTCPIQEPFHHTFTYTFKATKVSCGEGINERATYSFPDKVELTTTVEPMHCGHGKMIVSRRPWFKRLFRR